ncbi:hypothetical protein HPP92_002627 [Vanilla planifolia]|uniref:Uncharacterized protein n=1 Tax=Vanilla planifolia TaxID=51239 RepID=A0A835VMJ3_VANPL|nr:hypothetical protein HPP92_002627 [Vanilla planifolia]
MEDGLFRKQEGKGGPSWEAFTSEEFREEGGKLVRVAVPMVAVSLVQYMINVISTMMVGHLGELPLQGPPLQPPYQLQWFHSLDWNGKRVGNTVWPSLWSTAVPEAWNAHI